MLTAPSPQETLASSAYINTALTSQRSFTEESGLTPWYVSFTLVTQRRKIHTDRYTDTDPHRYTQIHTDAEIHTSSPQTSRLSPSPFIRVEMSIRTLIMSSALV